MIYGQFSSEVTKKPLQKMPYAQAEVITIGTSTRLVSYNTIAAEITNNILTIYGLYSATTRKHISAFVSEYANMQYQTARFLYENNLRMDIVTGEVFE